MLKIIEKYQDIIDDFKIIKYVQEGSLYSFVGTIIFKNKSKLAIKDYLFENFERKYVVLPYLNYNLCVNICIFVVIVWNFRYFLAFLRHHYNILIMEATIKIDEKKTFQALVQFLRSLNIDVDTKIIKKEKRHRKEAEINKLTKSKSKKNVLSNLIGMYESGIRNGSVNHDKELYNESSI